MHTQSVQRNGYSLQLYRKYRFYYSPFFASSRQPERFDVLWTHLSAECLFHGWPDKRTLEDFQANFNFFFHICFNHLKYFMWVFAQRPQNSMAQWNFWIEYNRWIQTTPHFSLFIEIRSGHDFLNTSRIDVNPAVSTSILEIWIFSILSINLSVELVVFYSLMTCGCLIAVHTHIDL